MSISVYVWKDTSQCTKNKLMHRATQDVGDALNAAKTIVDDVKERGDAALVDYALKFDGAAISQNSIKVTSDEFDAAECSLSEEVKDAIKHCAENVRKFHLQQMQRVEKNWRVEINSGVFAGEKVSPIPSV